MCNSGWELHRADLGRGEGKAGRLHLHDSTVSLRIAWPAAVLSHKSNLALLVKERQKCAQQSLVDV